MNADRPPPPGDPRPDEPRPEPRPGGSEPGSAEPGEAPAAERRPDAAADPYATTGAAAGGDPYEAEAASPGPAAYPPPPAGKPPGRPWTIAGLVCGLLALLLVPIIFGPLGIIFGFVGKSKGDPMGQWVGIGSIVTTVLGILLGLALTQSLDEDLILAVW